MKNMWIIWLIALFAIAVFGCISISVSATTFDNFNSQSRTLWKYSYGSWGDVFNASSGIVQSDSRVDIIGGADPPYQIARAFYFFNTSNIPDNAVISSVVLTTYYDSLSGQPFNLYGRVCRGGSSLSTDDFNVTKYSKFVFFNLSITGTELYISFTENVSSCINLTGISCFVVQISGDINKIPITGFKGMACSNTSKIKLDVEYHVTPSSPIYFEALSKNATRIELNWSKATGADKTVIICKQNSYPILGVDSVLYNGTLSSYNHTGLTNNSHWFYKCYSWNNSGVGCYNLIYIRGHDTTTGNTTSIIWEDHHINTTWSHFKKLLANNSWYIYDNDTGNTTPLHTSDIKVNCTGTLGYTQNSTGYWVTSNHIGTITPLTLFQNILHSTGTHQQKLNGSGYTVWANYSGNAPTFIPSNNTIYTTGKYETNWDSNNWIYRYWMNFTGAIPTYIINNNTAHTTGKYETAWNPATWTKTLWLNYTGALPIFNHYENIINATGTHQHNTVNSGYTINSWANYTGNLTGLHLDDNIDNATGTHVYLQNSTGWWAWANYTGNLTPINSFDNIINATGSHIIIQNSTGYWDWANYTGMTTPLNIFENIGNAFGVHDNLLNNTGYWVWANYTSSQLSRENVVNATGTHDSRWNASMGTWMTWANYTGSLTPLHKFENVLFASGTHTGKQNGTGYWVWANYTGDPSSLSKHENIVNTTGTHDDVYDLLSNTYDVWANYTGDLTALHLDENIDNATGTHVYLQNSTGWWAWANYTGNLTPINSFDNIINATGSHIIIQNSTGYWDWANYTGNTTGITWSNNHQNTTWSHVKQLLSNNSWFVYDNDSGITTPIHLTSSIQNATGNLTYSINSSGYYVNATYAGNTTTLTWIDSHLGSTWSHSHYLLLNNSWKIYDNDTGIGNITYLNISGNVDVSHMGNVTGMINVTMGIDINQVSIGVLLLLMAFFAILGYAINNAKTQAGFMMFAGIFSILAMISVDVYFGGIWYLSTPGFIVVAIIFFKDMLLMILYGEKWKDTRSKK